MNVFSLLKRLGSFRKASADDTPAALQPRRPDLTAPADSEADTADFTLASFTPASWPSGERKQRQLQPWGADS